MSRRLRYGMANSAKDKQPAHSPGDKRALGQLLALARKTAGLSLEGAATALRGMGYEISKAGVGHWETGKNVPDALWLKRLARLYGTSTDALAGIEGAQTWPFSLELRAKVEALDPQGLHAMERAMWAHMDEDVPESVAETARQRLRQRGAGVNGVTSVAKAKRTS